MQRIRLSFFILLFLWPCYYSSAAVVTSVRPIALIAAAITDGVTSTEIIVPDGASPHDYALRPSDIKTVRSADLVVWVGPDMEGFLQKALRQVKAERLLTLSTQPAIKGMLQRGSQEEEHEESDHDDHHHGEYDMHIWLSPEIAKAIAVAIHNKLVTLYPQDKEKLAANLQDFEKKVRQAEENIAKLLLPVREKGFFVFHDAYGYFETSFRLNGLGYFTLNPEIQPGAQTLNKIRSKLLQNKAVCVFAEPQFKPAIIYAVTQGTHVHTGTLDPLAIGIEPGKGSYVQFLMQLSGQFLSCLKED
ncbi:MAG: zinc ABC transporter substrate-binding protein ZnuA [Enterobacteriaceae bacterium]